MRNDLRNLVIGMTLAVNCASGPVGGTTVPCPAGAGDCVPLSPTALVAAPDGKSLLIACATARRVVVFDLATNQVVRNIDVPEAPLGLALAKDGSRLYVTCAAPASTICVVDVAAGRIAGHIPAGHTAMAPVLSPDERTLYVCNRFNHDVSVIDLAANREIRRIQVSREPVAATITPDGRLLLVANHVYDRHKDGAGVAATISVVDPAVGRTIKQIKLPRGSGLLRGIAVSPDGRFAAVTHLLARYYLPTTEVDFGRINGNALSLVDLNRLELRRVVLLDFARRAAANPWAVTWTPDGKTIALTHAGTHEVSLVDAPVLPQRAVGVRARLALPGNGPRALAAVGSRIYVANYFSDNLSVIDLAAPHPTVEAIALAPPVEPCLVRKGEMFFNDATLCYQGWQSCASCHDADARMDGLNWDLLNDGLGNPKNARSLVWAHRTPPAMSLGVRATAEAAVRAGLRHILFTEQPEEVPAAMDAYLKSLQPVCSPHRLNGRLSAAAERGQQLFMKAEVGCAHCHPPPWFTDLRTHGVGTRGRYDQSADRFDTPALVELWRTAPYLHDGSAASIRDVLVSANPQDRHGRTSHLSPEQLNDLSEFLLSL